MTALDCCLICRSGSVGGTDHVVISRETAPARVASDTILDAVRQFVVDVIVGALALWWLPRLVAASDRVLRQRPILALGGGVLAQRRREPFPRTRPPMT